MRVFSNTAMSLDGKIATRHARKRLGSEHDLIRMRQLYDEADAIVMGGNTFRDWPIPLYGKTHSESRPVWNVIVTRRSDLPFSESYWEQKKIRPLVLTSNSKIHNEKKNVEAVYFKDDIRPPDILAELQKRGVENVLIVGGGNLLFQFLNAGCLNEMFVTLCPKIIGKVGAPGLVDGAGFKPESLRQLHLKAFHAIQDEIYLHYEVLR